MRPNTRKRGCESSAANSLKQRPSRRSTITITARRTVAAETDSSAVATVTASSAAITTRHRGATTRCRGRPTVRMAPKASSWRDDSDKNYRKKLSSRQIHKKRKICFFFLYDRWKNICIRRNNSTGTNWKYYFCFTAGTRELKVSCVGAWGRHIQSITTSVAEPPLFWAAPAPAPEA